MTVPIAKFKNVTKIYKTGLLRRRQLIAVNDVTLHVAPGEVLGLVGPNRAGKTTLIKMLLSLCQPTSGEVKRFGLSSKNRSTLKDVGYVHEDHSFPRYLSAKSLLEFYGALSLAPYAEVRQRIPQLLKKVGLDDRADEPISQFSKGMLQRLGMAQALINDPKLLVLDEPTEGLDLMGRQILRDVTQEMRSKGRSVLLVSHVITEIEQLADRVAVLNQGKVQHVGSVEDIVKKVKKAQSLEDALQELYGKAS